MIQKKFTLLKVNASPGVANNIHIYIYHIIVQARCDAFVQNVLVLCEKPMTHTVPKNSVALLKMTDVAASIRWLQ